MAQIVQPILNCWWSYSAAVGKGWRSSSLLSTVAHLGRFGRGSDHGAYALRMYSFRAFQWAAVAIFVSLVVGLLAAHLTTHFNAAEWQAVGTVIAATVAAPTLLLLASQLAMATKESRDARSPILVPDVEHADPSNPGTNIYFVLRNVGGGAAQQVRMRFTPPLDR